MPIVVGVDAGGTSTVVAVEDEGGNRGVREFPAASPSVVGAREAGESLIASLQDALSGRVPHAIVVGAAGAGRADVSGALAAAIRNAYPTSYVDVGDDARIALRAAVPDGNGAVVIAGTGSIVYAEFGGQRVRAGGYGYAFGDEGSAFAVGAAALRHLARVRDGRTPADRLSEMLGGAEDPGFEHTLGAIYEPGKTIGRVASFAEVTMQLANDGVRSANKIVQAAALELFELLKTVMRAAPKGTQIPVALCGGLLGANSLLTYLLETRIAHELPDVQVLKRSPAPVEGALSLARAALQ